MILQQSFTRDWLLKVNSDLNWNRRETQLKNLEKAVAALYLLECLSKANIDFIFKGGTSLLLLLGKIYRLSVDIDLIIETPLTEPLKVFTQVCSDSKLFFRFEKQVRETDSIFNTEHYKFFYRPFADGIATGIAAGIATGIATGIEESFILLDLYTMKDPYAKTIELALISDVLCSDGDNVSIRMPDVDSILGDKLTAFAPTTIGIPLSAESGYRPKRVEVLKQLFDIGNLFDHVNNVAHIRETYRTIALHEIRMLGLDITPDDTLRDSARFATIIGHGGKIEKEQHESIEKGYKDFNKFVADLSFDENQAILAAAKTAYLVKVLLHDDNTIEKEDGTADMRSWEITDKAFVDFNDYKYSNPEAFFYWFKALQ